MAKLAEKAAEVASCGGRRAGLPALVQRLRQHGLVLVAVSAAAAMASCGGARGEAAPPAGSSVSAGPASPAALNELVVMLTEQQLKDAGAAQAMEYPAAILADRRITFAEYEGAVLQLVACAAGGNARPEGGSLRLDAAGVYRLAFAWDPADSSTASKAVEECGRRYLSPVQLLWAEGRAGAITQSDVNAARGVFWDCIEGAGVKLNGRPRASSSLDYVMNEPGGLQAFVNCQDRIYREFGLDSFGG